MNASDDLGDPARAVYRRACERLDPATRTRLRDMRARALAAAIDADREPHRPAPRWALAACALLVVLAWPRSTPSELDLPASALSLDAPLLDEDPEIFDWLATAPVATNPPEPEIN